MIKPKGIYFTGASGADRLFCGLSKELKKLMNIEPYFIVTAPKQKDCLIKEGIDKKQVHLVWYQKQTLIENPNLDFLKKKEEEYGFLFWDFWEITASRKKSRDKIQKKIILSWFEYIVRISEKIIREIKPEYFITFNPAGFHVLIMYSIMKKHGIKIIDLSTSPITNKFSVVDSIDSKWPLIEKEYLKICNKGITEKERKQVIEYIINYRQSPTIVDCRKKYSQPFLDKLKLYLYHAKSMIKYREIPSIRHYYLWPLTERFYDLIEIFEKSNKKDKYVLFNLHFQPEILTSLYGKWYMDHPSLVESISKSLPLGYTLYVKDHPDGYGNRKLRFYKRIKRLANVKLIHPKENNFELIKNASVVITITGTSGWEGLLFQKPILTFGDVYYNICKEVKKVEKTKDISSLIKERLDKEIDFEEVIKFVATMFRSTIPGLANMAGDCCEISTKKENNQLLANGIKDYVARVYN